MLQRFRFWQLLLLCLLVCSPLSAFGASISIVPSGDGSTFYLRGSGLGGLHGLDVTVSYDSSAISSARVVKGPLLNGALAAINDGLPGTIRFGVVTTSGLGSDGLIATITFNRTGSSTGLINLSASGVTADNKTVRPGVVPYDGRTATAGSTGDTSTGSSSGSSSGTTDTTNPPAGQTPSGSPLMVGGTLTIPGDTRAQGETPPQPPQGEEPAQQDQPPQQEPAAQQEAPQQEPAVQEAPQQEPQQEVAPSESQPAPEGVPAEDDGAAVEPDGNGGQSAAVAQPPQGKLQRREVSSILERFRLYQGERTPQKLMQLFERGDLSFFTQRPPIVLSDGQAIATVIIRGGSLDLPTFAFKAAYSILVKKVATGEWQVQAKPVQGAVRAAISMNADGVTQDFPLTVAPPARVDLVHQGALGEEDFEYFLRERGTPQAPKYDLNGDGRRDYLDDYIFTANYLMATGHAAAPRREPAPQKKAPQR